MSGFVRCQRTAPHSPPHVAIEDGVAWRWDGAGGRAADFLCGDELGSEYPGVVCLKPPHHAEGAKLWGPEPAHVHQFDTHGQHRGGDGPPRTYQWLRRWARDGDPGALELKVAEHDGTAWRPVSAQVEA